jgi:hypothetical protein
MAIGERIDRKRRPSIGKEVNKVRRSRATVVIEG